MVLELFNIIRNTKGFNYYSLVAPSAINNMEKQPQEGVPGFVTGCNTFKLYVNLRKIYSSWLHSVSTSSLPPTRSVPLLPCAG